MSHDDFLASETLDQHEWRGVDELANALVDFEPLSKRGRLGATVAERLVARGLAEKGPCSDRYRGVIGYRLTDLGWKVKDRGRHPRRRG